MIYIDTSVLVASFTVESSTLVAQSWLTKHRGVKLAISPWVKTEFYSALAMKRRLNEISDVTYAAISRQFERMALEAVWECAIQHAHFEAATRIVAQHELKLRASDALHLAVASDNGAALCTLDQRMFDAATALGIKALMP